MRLYYRFMRFLSQVAMMLYFRMRVFGVGRFPKTGGVLLVSNHQSFLDPLLATCAVYREGNYMARDTLFANPLFGRLIASLNAFPVKRGAGDVGAVKETLRRLKAGKVVLVFPEGTRTRDGSIGTINPNSLSIARRAGVAIVPAVVDGAYEAWPRSKSLPRPGTVYVTYAEPLTAEQVRTWPGEQVACVVNERMHTAMAQSNAKRRRALSQPQRPAPSQGR